MPQNLPNYLKTSHLFNLWKKYQGKEKIREKPVMRKYSFGEELCDNDRFNGIFL